MRPSGGCLRDDPDRYIYAAVRRGVVDDTGNVLPESALPDFVRTGMNDPKARMFDRRYNLGEADLNLPSPAGRGAGGEGGEKLTLPTETWREYVCRRQRCLEAAREAQQGRSHRDQRPDHAEPRHPAIRPGRDCRLPVARTAGSIFRDNSQRDGPRSDLRFGAFLFAALNILEPLYEACLDRMEGFLAAAESKTAAKTNGNGGGLPSPAGRGAGGEGRRPSAKAKCLDEFRAVLKSVNDDHPNAAYFIFKSIIIRNLFGVDIMEEATEICKLRLFLKLVAQVDPDPSKPNLGVEPLP